MRPCSRSEDSRPAPSRAPRNVAEFDELFRQVSNWGRWGKDDQLGAANLITDAKRKQAAGLVKNGVSVSLAHNAITEKAVDNPSPFEHTMNPGFFMDTYKVSYHGYAHSHIDALCHILYKDQTYNGYARAEVNTEKGCTKLGIDNPQERCRDARHPHRHSASEEPPVSRAGHGDLRRGPRSVGEEGRREGVAGRRGARPHRPMGAAREARAVERRAERRGRARIGRSVVQGARRRVRSAATRRSTSTPSLVEGNNLPVHTLFITAMGIHLLDNQDLEAVSAHGREVEPLGVHADDRAGARDRRHGIPAQRARDVLSRRAEASASAHAHAEACALDDAGVGDAARRARMSAFLMMIRWCGHFFVSS